MKKLSPLSAKTFRSLNISEELHATHIYQENYEVFHIHRLEEVKEYLQTNGTTHRKNIPDFILLTKGSAKRSIGLEMYDIIAPAMLILPAYAIVSNHYLSEDVEGYYCHFSTDFIANKLMNSSAFRHFSFLESNNQPLLKLPEKSTALFVQSLEQIITDYQSTLTNKHEIIFHELMSFFFRIQNLWEVQHSINQTSKKISFKYKKLLVEKFPTLNTVQEFADELNVTPNHLNKVIKEETGISASTFIKDMIILQAKVLLKDNEKESIAAISEYLKFSEPSHFTRFFKQKTGKTPREYRDA
ncbi:helix-turn-helix domain-containing protein [Tenacibaculum amylolyticum]|uniref:helix-turn-helix domain-containing protein n=1 Tax=Tenacibaculum amylolyticum TaxID=104269 RepID=UPI003896606D